MRKKILSVVMIAIMVFAFGLFALGSGSKESGESSQNTSSTSDSSTKKSSDDNAVGTKNNPLTIGNTMESKGLKITLNDADLNYTGYDNRYGLHTPQDGYKYISATFTYQNDGQNDAYVSIYDFKCYADGAACQEQYGLEADSSLSNNFINTNLSSGRNVSFTTFYAVPENAGSIELEYEANIWSNKKAYIKLQ